MDNGRNEIPIKEYRTSKGWRIFFCLLSPPMIALSLYFMMMPFIERRSNDIVFLTIALLLGGGLSALMFYGMLSILKWRIEIYSNKIREINLFKINDIIISEIKGVEILPTQYLNLIQFVPKAPHAKKYKIGLMMDNASDFMTWVDATFINLTLKNYEKEVASIIQAEQLGINEEQRLSVLERAKKYARFVNGMGICSVFWALLFPHPYKVMIGVLIVLPVMSLIVMRLFPGVVKLDAKQFSVHPSIANGFLMPCCGLGLRTLLDWNIIICKNFWMLCFLFSLMFFALSLIVAKDIRRQIFNICFVLVICFAYGYGVTVNINGLADNSIPQVYQAQIVNKRLSDGKTTSYYFDLSPWGPKKNKNDIKVSKTLYQQKKISDTVNVLVHGGVFNIQWVHIR